MVLKRLKLHIQMFSYSLIKLQQKIEQLGQLLKMILLVEAIQFVELDSLIRF